MGLLQLQQQNISAPTAYTEYSVAIPPRVNEVTLSLRINDTLYWYMTSTPNGTNNTAGLPATYGTIPAGASRTIRGMLGGQTIYFQVATSQGSQVLEVDYYADN